MNHLQTETERLTALKRYDILGTPADGSMNRLAALAAKVFNMPIAIISMVDEDRIWFKSRHGLDVDHIDRDPGLCASAILSDEVYIVEDARRDPRTLTNPLVAGEFGLQFYAAAPLRTHDGYNLGTFCLIDQKPRYLTQAQKAILQDLADLAMDEIELRLAARQAAQESTERIAELEMRAAGA
ncbi:GAF domain-containing protein [Hymenobacter taeanensis]|uniref:GAF domain-containing protein n=1 Tax=Hymenobacter taeanensis TaxID=2735321 RepID=A0A6M6BCU5_9BACT|nr:MULTISPECIES: GAF domain-containing protein [Hymenobacter]QJX45638.1 GAF domain-containing protein [Hymenobacter taeanensis]UOQ79474.1 GAF domain-containing protein [Hymenobacter sp. 5414T-23]